MFCSADAEGVGAGGSEAGVELDVSTVVKLRGWPGRGWPRGRVAMVSSGVI